jgi:type I restriction enzyme S subunit
LYAILNTDKFTNKVLDLCTGTSYPAISPKALSSILISFPKNESDQNYLADLFESTTSEINILETTLSKYQSIKQGMMQNLLTGKIRLL